MKAHLSPEALRRALILIPGGKLIWANPSEYHCGLIGYEAGGPVPSHNGKVYWKVSIGGRKYSRSRLVFCFIHGRWPTDQIDHIDGDSLNDSPSNLREATVTQNAWNHHKRAKKSLLPMGVKALPSGRFQARIAVNKKSLSLGVFATEEEASAVYRAARSEHFGAFA